MPPAACAIMSGRRTRSRLSCRWSGRACSTGLRTTSRRWREPKRSPTARRIACPARRLKLVRANRTSNSRSVMRWRRSRQTRSSLPFDPPKTRAGSSPRQPTPPHSILSTECLSTTSCYGTDRWAADAACCGSATRGSGYTAPSGRIPGVQPRLERQARNEALVREVNERIDDLDREAEECGATPEGLTYGFHCECGREGGCEKVVWMTLAEYEVVRQQDDRFTLAPGHEN